MKASMFSIPVLPFADIYTLLEDELVTRAPTVHVGEWQSQRGDDKGFNYTREVTQVYFRTYMPETSDEARAAYQPNLPWAEDHFQERVSGTPHNPPPSAAYWPFTQKDHEEHTAEGKFSHTYPERMWPKYANVGSTRPNGREVFVPHNGIRFEYGDLRDLVELLALSPMTRQAYLPIWFPEDGAAVHQNERVPCTLGYHFLLRPHPAYEALVLNMTYYMRSCDFLRYFNDDVYMAARLAQWVRGQVTSQSTGPIILMGDLAISIASLHIFENDVKLISMRQAGRAFNGPT